MRRVRYYNINDIRRNKRQLIGEATFLQFGVDYEEFETGPGNYSTAIIELDNGEIKNFPLECIQFIKDSE